jgi:membrane protease YdiL (CAAX protease family)
MSNASSSEKVPVKKTGQVAWNPWAGVVLTIALFIFAQFAASLIVILIPQVLGWSSSEAKDWLNNSVASKVILISLTTTFLLVPLYFYLKRYKGGFKSIGLRRPNWTDPLYSLAALPVYIFLFALVLLIATRFAPGLDVNQAQDLGFNDTYNPLQLFFIAIALVVLPPISEEIIFRGMLYSSLKKGMPIILAAIFTSLLFASGHLLESGDSSLLYIAGIDTFVLSLVLIYLREKTGGLWASIGLHAIKNGIAFVSLFLLHAR